MKLSDLYILERSLDLPDAGADPMLHELQRENRILARLAGFGGCPPDRERQLRTACSAQPGLPQPVIIKRLLSARASGLRILGAAGLLACIAAVVVLAPRISLTTSQPRAAYPQAWAEHESHVLLFDFGRVTELGPDVATQISGPTMTVALAKAITEMLRASVQMYSYRSGQLPRLGVFAYHSSVAEKLVTRDPQHGNAVSDRSQRSEQRYVAGIVLDDPAEAPAILDYVKGIPLLPQGRLVDSTQLGAAGLADPGQAGVTIGLKLLPPPSFLTNTDLELRTIRSGTPDAPQEETVLMPKRQLNVEAAEPVYKVFSYPAGATPKQIEAHIAEWLARNREFYDYTVGVGITGSGLNREVSVEIVGHSEANVPGSRDQEWAIYITEPDGALRKLELGETPASAAPSPGGLR